MSTPTNQIESVQPDVYYKLLSEPWFNNISIFRVREKRLDSEVNRALSGLAARNGKSGATIEVLFPTLKSAETDSPGPVSTLEQKFVVKCNETINQGANGTGLSVETIAVQIAQTFQKFFLGGPLNGFYPAPTFYEAAVFDKDAPLVGVVVTLHATLALPPLPQCAQPAISAPAQTVTLTDQQPGGGSSIYYTTDGSFPGAGNPAAVLYSAPFTVASGTTIRVAAYINGLSGSMVANAIIV